MANSEVVAERLASEIRAQDSLHSSLIKDLAKVAARNYISISLYFNDVKFFEPSAIHYHISTLFIIECLFSIKKII